VAEHRIDINFDEILRIVLVGVNRAVTFMGYGINAAEDPNFRSYELTKFANIQLLPDNLSEERIAEDKKNFRRWIEGNGLRELTESFSLFVDAIHHACMFIGAENPVVASFDPLREQSVFAKLGLKERLRLLKTKFGVEPKHAEQLISINRSRNCLSHRWGTVGSEDAPQGQLEVSWLGLDLLVAEPNGRETVWKRDSEAIMLREGGNVIIRVSMRRRSFKVGEQLSLLTEDLAEICWFYSNEAKHIHQSALDFTRSKGHHIPTPPQPTE
jgi:hypothetical protein